MKKAKLLKHVILGLIAAFTATFFFEKKEKPKGQYVTPQHAEQSLRNIFSLSAAKHYFYEAMPSISNPLGIGQRAMPLACKVQNLLIADFLNYLALRHGIYLSTLSEVLKKNSMTKP